MDKTTADALAIKMAICYLNNRNSISTEMIPTGEQQATQVANFIKTLSSRLQTDVDEEVNVNIIDIL